MRRRTNIVLDEELVERVSPRTNPPRSILVDTSAWVEFEGLTPCPHSRPSVSAPVQSVLQTCMFQVSAVAPQ